MAQLFVPGQAQTSCVFSNTPDNNKRRLFLSFSLSTPSHSRSSVGDTHMRIISRTRPRGEVHPGCRKSALLFRFTCSPTRGRLRAPTFEFPPLGELSTRRQRQNFLGNAFPTQLRESRDAAPHINGPPVVLLAARCTPTGARRQTRIRANAEEKEEAARFQVARSFGATTRKYGGRRRRRIGLRSGG